MLESLAEIVSGLNGVIESLGEMIGLFQDEIVHVNQLVDQLSLAAEEARTFVAGLGSGEELSYMVSDTLHKLELVMTISLLCSAVALVCSIITLILAVIILARKKA